MYQLDRLRRPYDLATRKGEVCHDQPRHCSRIACFAPSPRHFGALIVALGIAGCAGMTPTQQRMTSGTLIGAGSGAVIGALAGNAAMGAGIGAAAGLAGGYLYQKYKENQAETYAKGYRQGQASTQSKKKQKKAPPQ
jgi:hypothetical protein